MDEETSPNQQLPFGYGFETLDRWRWVLPHAKQNVSHTHHPIIMINTACRVYV